jgi:hypothetical protein
MATAADGGIFRYRDTMNGGIDSIPIGLGHLVGLAVNLYLLTTVRWVGEVDAGP